MIHAYISAPRPHSAVGHGPDRRFRHPVQIIESRGAATYHFKACEPRAPIYRLLIDILFEGPYLLQPGFQRQILLHSPHQGHGGMGMHIDKTGYRTETGSLYHRIRSIVRTRPYFRDYPVIYVNISPSVIQKNVFN